MEVKEYIRENMRRTVRTRSTVEIFLKFSVN